MGFPCQQKLLNGWRYLSPRHGMKCVVVTLVSWGPSKSSPSLDLIPSHIALWPQALLVMLDFSFNPILPPLPGNFLGRNCHYKSFKGSLLWDAKLLGTMTCNYHTVIINAEKTLLSLPPCSSNESDSV